MNSKEIIPGPCRLIGTVYRDDQFAKCFDTLDCAVYSRKKGPEVLEPSLCFFSIIIDLFLFRKSDFVK